MPKGDPVEERDIQKILEALDDPRIVQKIADSLICIPVNGWVVPKNKKGDI